MLRVLLAGANTLIYTPRERLGLLSIPVAFCFGGSGRGWGLDSHNTGLRRIFPLHAGPKRAPAPGAQTAARGEAQLIMRCAPNP